MTSPSEWVTNKDPDGNNIKDTYALGGYDYRFYDHIFPAYGIIWPRWIEENGKIISSAVQPGAKEALRTLNKLYEMGALDPEFVTDNMSRTKEKYLSGIYGAMCYSRFIFDTLNLNNYYTQFHENNPGAELVEGPVLQGPGSRDGVSVRANSTRGWIRNGVYAKSKEIDGVMRVLDWMNSDEGIMFSNYGIENEHYTYKDRVVTVLTTVEQQQELGITQFYIGYESLSLHNSVELQRITAYGKSLATPNAVDGLVVPEAALYQNDVEDYARTQYLNIIIGEVSVDEGFDALLAEWKRRGGEELTAAFNKAYQAKQKR